MNEAAHDKMLRARTALILDEPFFGALALRLKLVEDPTCKRLWVDGRSLGYNPDFVLSLTPQEVIAGLVHEVLHVAEGHLYFAEAVETTGARATVLSRIELPAP